MSSLTVKIGYLNYKKLPPNIVGGLIYKDIIDLTDNTVFFSPNKKGMWKLASFGKGGSPDPNKVENTQLVTMIEIGECQKLEINDELFEV
jgi:hypothetical protein